MQINSQNHVVVTNTASGQGMSVDESEQALFFQIMSSQIYQHKVKAVVRELVCNALDSHKEVGTKQPIRIKVPNKLEPWFSVQDFGTGMSDEFIRRVYTKALKSTKRDNGEAIGGFGVGKLAPLSYVDQFTLESTYNGVNTIYSVYKNEYGVPDVTKVTSYETDKSNGVLVKVAALEHSFKEFTDEVAGLVKWLPEEYFSVVGSTEEFPGLNSEWVTTEQENYGYLVLPYDTTQDHVVVVGGVPYPLPSSVEVTKLEGVIGRGWGNPKIAINVGINDVEVAVSRESLSVTPSTKVYLQGCVDNTAKHLLGNYQERLNTVDSLHGLFDAAEKRIVSRISKDLTYRGKNLLSYSLNITNNSKLPAGADHIGFSSNSYVNVRPLKKFSLNMEPWSDTINILVLDQKTHVQFNRNTMYEKGGICFQCIPESLPALLELFKHFEVNVEKLSERVAAGCRPEKTPNSSKKTNQRGYKCYTFSKDHCTSHHLNRAAVEDLYKKYTSEGKTVYIKSMSLQKIYEVKSVTDTRYSLPDDAVVLLTNIPVGEWLRKRHKIPELKDMVWTEEQKKSILAGYYWRRRDNSWEANRAESFLKSLKDDVPELIADMGAQVQRAVLGDHGTNSLNIFMFRELKKSSQSNPWEGLSGKLEKAYAQLQDKYPLLNIGNVRNSEKEAYIWYIKARNKEGELQNAA